MARLSVRRVLSATGGVLSAAFLLYVLLSWRRAHTYDIDNITVSNSSTPPDHTPLLSPELSRTTNASQTTKRILIVSGLFQFNKSKHSWELYERWLGMFLGQIRTDVYFYTSPDFEQRIRKVRADSAASASFLKINASYATPFAVPPMEGLENTYAAMHWKDRERKIHGPELYAVWNAKPFFTDAAVKEMKREGREYDYVFWVDAGTFRQEHTYQKWPDPWRVWEFFQEASDHQEDRGREAKDKIMFPINNVPSYWYRFWKEDMGPVDFEFSKGSFFGGPPSPIEWYSSTFYAYHNNFLSLGYFVGKDQTLINALLLLFPHRFAVQWQRDPRTTAQFWPTGKCGSDWYYYEHVLANEQERAAMEKMWKDRMNWWEQGIWRKMHDLHPNASKRCPISPGLSLQRLAEEVFGYGWKRDTTTLIHD